MRTSGSKNRDTPERRRSILDAALQEFAEHGYERATLDRIARRVGVTKGSLYHHFASKEAIAIALYAGAVEGPGAQLLTTRGYGHNRILGAPELVARLTSFLHT